MKKNLPNQLTILRLLLAGVFFFVINQFRYERGHDDGWILWLAMGIFIAAMLTDIADGYLARKWNVESTFGRIMDPFVDKVIVLGALIYLAGPRFIDPEQITNDSHMLFNIVPANIVTGMYPWMVALMLARELLVTSIRGEMEARGVKFGAKKVGKLKTLFQSIGIPFLIGIVALDPNTEGHEWMKWVRGFFAYGMTIMTVASGIPYVTGAMTALKGDKAS